MKNNNLLNTNIIGKWNDYYFKINNKNLINYLIKLALENLFIERFNDVLLKQFILIQFKIRFSTGEFRSISYVQTITKEDFNLLPDSFLSFQSIISEDYQILTVDQINFTYKIIPLDEIKESKFNIHTKIINNNKPSFKISGFNLPCTMD